MQPVESALLFVGKPNLALERFGETLNARVAFLGVEFDKDYCEPGVTSRFSAPGLELTVVAVADALPATAFDGAMSSPLSQARSGLLAETLFRHNRHILLTLKATPDDTVSHDRLTMLRLAHAATILLTEWHLPAAIHWRQSNQMLMGSQYLDLARDKTPWALFARADFKSDADDENQGPRALELPEGKEFLGRPIVFAPTDWPEEEMHATALSFLRHSVENDGPIPDGHSFGLDDKQIVRVGHEAPDETYPYGCFRLTAVERPEGGFVSSRPSAVALRGQSVELEPVNAYSEKEQLDQIDPNDRTRSLAVSYMMLVIMPPIGLLLLVTNAIFGADAWRTSLIATASVALALAVGAYTFLTYVGQETAVFIDPTPVQQTVLQD